MEITEWLQSHKKFAYTVPWIDLLSSILYIVFMICIPIMILYSFSDCRSIAIDHRWKKISESQSQKNKRQQNFYGNEYNENE